LCTYCDVTGLKALYTVPRTTLRYHDTSVYDRQKTRTFRLSSRGQNPTMFSCRVLASQKTTSLLVSSGARGPKLPIRTRLRLPYG
ncbi:hypothetical protein EV363DRAFT_1179028, partial [Boletus edulis]